MRKTIHDTNEINELAKEVLNILYKKQPQDHATLVFLSGDLGSGKTTFMQFLAKELKTDSMYITSPTFNIIKSYKVDNEKFDELVHVDSYRLSNGKELMDLKFQEVLNKPKTLICIEWPEKVMPEINNPDLQLTFSYVDPMTRGVEISE